MFRFLNVITILWIVFSSKEPHSRMSGTLFERLNRQIIDPNYVLPPLNSDNNIKGSDCRIITDINTSSKNTFGENIYNYERLKQLLLIKETLFVLSPVNINCILRPIYMPIKGNSFELECKESKPHVPYKSRDLPVFVMEPLPVASCRNIKNGGLFDDFLFEL
jgi:hypothetical protein